MDLTIDEFQKLSDDKSLQSMRIADLERRLAEKTKENALLKDRVKCLEMANTAEKIKNIILRNCITLSVEKVRLFVKHLNGIDRFAFLKTFLEFVLPNEYYQEQLLLVNEVMTMPEPPQAQPTTIDNRTINLTGDHATYEENPKE